MLILFPLVLAWLHVAHDPCLTGGPLPSCVSRSYGPAVSVAGQLQAPPPVVPPVRSLPGDREAAALRVLGE